MQIRTHKRYRFRKKEKKVQGMLNLGIHLSTPLLLRLRSVPLARIIMLESVPHGYDCSSYKGADTARFPFVVI